MAGQEANRGRGQRNGKDRARKGRTDKNMEEQEEGRAKQMRLGQGR